MFCTKRVTARNSRSAAAEQTAEWQAMSKGAERIPRKVRSIHRTSVGKLDNGSAMSKTSVGTKVSTREETAAAAHELHCVAC